jgi:threonine aldolase
VDRLAEDHERARQLATGLAELPGVAVDAARVETNIVIFDVRGAGITAEEFGRRTERSGVRFSVLGPTLVRAVMHLDVPADGVERALSAARAALRG